MSCVVGCAAVLLGGVVVLAKKLRGRGLRVRVWRRR